MPGLLLFFEAFSLNWAGDALFMNVGMGKVTIASSFFFMVNITRQLIKGS